MKVMLDGGDIATIEIPHSRAAAQAASVVSTISRSPPDNGRASTGDRRIGINGCVLEGRDIGSVVFKRRYQIFLT